MNLDASNRLSDGTGKCWLDRTGAGKRRVADTWSGGAGSEVAAKDPI
jgi:hypothetical protein